MPKGRAEQGRQASGRCHEDSQALATPVEGCFRLSAKQTRGTVHAGHPLPVKLCVGCGWGVVVSVRAG